MLLALSEIPKNASDLYLSDVSQFFNQRHSIDDLFDHNEPIVLLFPPIVFEVVHNQLQVWVVENIGLGTFLHIFIEAVSELLYLAFLDVFYDFKLEVLFFFIGNQKTNFLH